MALLALAAERNAAASKTTDKKTAAPASGSSSGSSWASLDLSAAVVSLVDGCPLVTLAPPI